MEVAVGAFFNGSEFVYPINVNFEHKKLFPGNLGPATGEMGTSMFWSRPNKIFNLTLKKMEEILKKEHLVNNSMEKVLDQLLTYQIQWIILF